MFEHLACMNIFAPHVCIICVDQKSVRVLLTRVIYSCEMPCVYCESNTGLLKEEPQLLADESPL